MFPPNANLLLFNSGCEDGAVVSWDMNTNQEIHRFYGDACGVNKVKFMQTDQLITLGSATGRHARQVKIWDLRMNGQQSECIALRLNSTEKSRSSSSSSSNSSRTSSKGIDRRYTCVCCHPIDEKLILGTAQGNGITIPIVARGILPYRLGFRIHHHMGFEIWRLRGIPYTFLSRYT